MFLLLSHVPLSLSSLWNHVTRMSTLIFKSFPFLLHYSMASCCFEILRWKKHLWCSIAKTSKRSASVIDLEVIRWRIVDPDIGFYCMRSCWVVRVQSHTARLLSHGLWSLRVRQTNTLLSVHMSTQRHIWTWRHVYLYRISKPCQILYADVRACSVLKVLLLLKWPQCH